MTYTEKGPTERGIHKGIDWKGDICTYNEIHKMKRQEGDKRRREIREGKLGKRN